MRNFWLSDGSLTVEQENRARIASRKLLAESAKFFRTANPKQREQFKKLRRFYQQATFGPALRTSWKRSRVALFLNDWQLFARSSGLIKNGQMRVVDALKYIQVLRPILEALHNKDDEFFSDLAIAIKFKKNQSRVNAFLAEYSVMMAGKRPVLTFGEIQKILGDMPRRTLREKLEDLRQEYGEFAVPLRRGKVGAPKKTRRG